MFIEASATIRIHGTARSALRRAGGLLRVAVAAKVICAGGCHSTGSTVEEIVGPPSAACVFAGFERASVPLVLETSEGAVRCTIDAVKAPRAAAMVAGLAMGRAPFRDPTSGEVVRRPYYQKMLFFRAIEDGLVQTGCPLGNGAGHPGYRLPVESDPSDEARLARPGALFLARYTPPPNRSDPAPPPHGNVIGTQLVVSLTDMKHLAGKVTVLGACADLEVVRGIARVVARKERRVELLRAGVAGDPGGVMVRGDLCRAAEETTSVNRQPR